MKRPDCTSHDENHRAPYQSPFAIYTHGHTQLVEPSGLQTDSRGYLWTARTNTRFIFVLAARSDNMLMSSLCTGSLPPSRRAKNYLTLGLTVSGSSKILQVKRWCGVKTDERTENPVKAQAPLIFFFFLFVPPRQGEPSVYPRFGLFFHHVQSIKLALCCTNDQNCRVSTNLSGNNMKYANIPLHGNPL